jgi:hypothetical protein
MSCGTATTVSAASRAAAVTVTLASPMPVVIDTPVVVEPISLDG